METKFKKDLNKYELDEDSLSNIKSNIYTKYKKHQRNKKIILSVVTCFFILISSLGIVYADEIKETVDKILVQYGYIIDEDGNKQDAIKVDLSIDSKINYQAKLEAPKCTKNIDWTYGIKKDDECYTTYSIEEIEKKLNIKLLKNELFVNNEYVLSIIRKNKENYIEHIEFDLYNPYNIKPNKNNSYKNVKGLKVQMSIRITTKYDKTNDNGTVIINDGENEVYKIKLDNLDAEAVVWSFGEKSLKIIWLEHKGIMYYFKVKAIGNIDENKEIEKMLNDFYY